MPKILPTFGSTSLRTLNYERAIVHPQVFCKRKDGLRTLNYERAIVQCAATITRSKSSQNPQLREGYCAEILLRLRQQLCLRTLNYERAIVREYDPWEETICLRTLNYERAIVLTEYNILYLLSNQIQKTDLFACN